VNYIGSKKKLSGFILEVISTEVGELNDKIFCDLFAGTGIIGRVFSPYVKKVISNDIEKYGAVLNNAYLTHNDHELELINELNNLKPIKGFIYDNYTPGGGIKIVKEKEIVRMYFTDYNGAKIDAIRKQIENWRVKRVITQKQYYYLLSVLLEAADKVANVASVYGAYLKKFKASAIKEIILEPLDIKFNENNVVYNKDSNTLIREIEGDILYLDPPYNSRQYSANYHILNTIVLMDTFIPKGVTGLRSYERSLYCSKVTIEKTFEDLISYANFEYIFLSYNNEGLMSLETIKSIMSKYGEYKLEQVDYSRFKADSKRDHKAESTIEYLHILKKRS